MIRLFVTGIALAKITRETGVAQYALAMRAAPAVAAERENLTIDVEAVVEKLRRVVESEQASAGRLRGPSTRNGCTTALRRET